jgi:hypothetical protein
MSALIQYLPFLGIVVLANYSEKRDRLKILVYVALGLLNVVMLLGSIVLLGIEALNQSGELAGYFPPELGFFQNLDYSRLSLTLGLIGGLAFLLLLRPVRRLLASFLPLEADSCLDCVALVFTVYYIGFTAAQLTLLGGLENLGQLEFNPSVLDLLMSGLILVAFAVLGVGWLIRRNGEETLQRLKLGPMPRKYWIWSVGLVLLFLLIDVVVSALWSWLDPASYDFISEATQGLFGGIDSIWLGLALALSTGVGEELLFRGAVQPRFGLVFTSLAFALGHLQYGVSPALIQVFSMSIILGLTRRKANTTSCVVVHMLYNLTELLVIANLVP